MEQRNEEEMRENFYEEYVYAIMKAPHSNLYRKLHTVIPISKVIEESKKLIMKASHLRRACGKFAYDEFLGESLRHLFDVIHPGNQNSVKHKPQKQFIVVGKTQSGKSSVKGIVQSLCGLLKIPLIVITKGVKESIELREKLATLADGTLMDKRHIIVASCDQDGCDTEEKKHLIYGALGGYHGWTGYQHAGTLIIADTEAQVNTAIMAISRYRKNIPGGKFILVMDEADAMSRTEDREQLFEQALEKLMELDPSMTIKISATIFPVMLDILHGASGSSPGQMKNNDLKFFELEADDEYVGHEDIKPLTIGGKEVYLDHGEIKSDVCYEGIPYANEKVMALYDDALLDTNIEKGILLIDCSCPYVNVPKNNVKAKAEEVQKYYVAQSKLVTVVTVTGDGTFFRFPFYEWDKKMKKSNIGDVIKHIDDECGLQMPIFIFGYTKICRGISFRSDKRVPTHVLVSLGKGHNCSTVIQTLGRATFNGSNVLQVDHVKCLTTKDDYILCANHSTYIEGVIERVKKGDSLAEAVAGANKDFPSIAEFLANTPREIGKMPGQGKLFQARLDTRKNITENPESLIGNRVAKYFDGELFQGTVDSYNSATRWWGITYEDDDEEEMNYKQIVQAMNLFKGKSSTCSLESVKNINGKRERDSSSSSVGPLLDIEDIPEIHKDDIKSSKFKRGTIFRQKEKNRCIYYANENDTPKQIANKYNLDVHQIIFNNKRRGPPYDKMSQKSKLMDLSTIVLPMEQTEMEI